MMPKSASILTFFECPGAPPVDDRANESLSRLLAARLKVSRSAVRIVAGEKSRTKRVAISGVTRHQVIALLPPEVSRSTTRNKTPHDARKTKD